MPEFVLGHYPSQITSYFRILLYFYILYSVSSQMEKQSGFELKKSVFLLQTNPNSSLAPRMGNSRLAWRVVGEAGQHGGVRRSSGRGDIVVCRLEYGERTRVGRAIATLRRCWRGRIGGEGQGEPWGRPGSGSSVRTRVNPVISAALWWTAQQTQTGY